MAGDWTKSDGAVPILALTLDQRPAWLWSASGKELVWRNIAAVLFRAKSRKHKIRLAPLPVPIKGQVSRLVRLGTPGRASLSRLRFLAGKKPVSATCLCTPLELEGAMHLLITDTEAVEAGLMSGAAWNAALEENLFGDGRAFAIAGADGEVLIRQGETGPQGKPRQIAIRAGAQLTLYDGADATPAGTLTGLVDRLAQSAALFEELDADSAAVPEAVEPPAQPAGPARVPEGGDRYLFALGPDGASFAGRAAPEGADFAELAGHGGFGADVPFELAQSAGTKISAIPVFDRHGARAGWRAYRQPDPETSDANGLWTVTGRSFAAQAEEPAAQHGPDAPNQKPSGGEPVAGADDSRGGDQQSRYNFDELSRILVDRIGGDDTAATTAPAPLVAPAPTAGGDLVPLSDETLVLNRLPLGLLVFRDQTILFANRAMADLTGHESTSTLREAGLAALFPDAPENDRSVGPVTRLRSRDGRAARVVARLQTISWQGRSAHLLSARAAETATAHPEPAGMTTRATVELIAAQSDCGFIQLTRTGNIDGISDIGASLIGPSRSVLLGRPLLNYLEPTSKPRFAGFLAQFGEAADQAVTVIADAGAGTAAITLFADRLRDGRAEGYLGLVRAGPRPEPAAVEAGVPDAELGSVLAQLSRELRVPLNTILGFAELMMGESGAAMSPARLAEYAGDIHSAGRQIGLLVDELTDLSRFQGGRFELDDTEIDLGILLETCVAQIRPRANARQIVVRSAVSQSLPAIIADRAVLTQTVMNMLASALSLSGRGGHVVLSAQLERDGAIGVHVREQGGKRPAEAAEGFVVYREAANGNSAEEEPLRSGTGLALTRSLAKANALSLSLDDQAGAGTFMALEIPSEKIVQPTRV